MKNFFQVGVVLLAIQLSASACSVPVFRYALERWPVSPYIALIVADAPLTADEQRAMDHLEKMSDGTSGSLNLMVRQWTSKQLAESTLADEFPKLEGGGARLHLLFPRETMADAPFWSGALSTEAVKKISDSPARQTLIEKILAGDSGVFILLECGDQKKNAEAAKALEAHVATLTEQMKLPNGIVNSGGEVSGGGPASWDPSDRLRSTIPFKVAFSSMRMAYTEDEDFLVALLLNLPENRNVSREEPMVFSVYGRGRVLEPLVGLEELSLDIINQIAYFLTGSCSCQVKSMNPGTDLLLNHDWDRSVFDWK